VNAGYVGWIPKWRDEWLLDGEVPPSTWRNLEGMFKKQRPEIKRESCAQPHEDGANEGESQIIHDSPAY
jgi:hypothetical protein